MKKITTLVLGLAMILSLVACGTTPSTSTTTSTTTSIDNSVSTSVSDNTSTSDNVAASIEDNTSASTDQGDLDDEVVNTGDTLGMQAFFAFKDAVDAGKGLAEIADEIALNLSDYSLMPASMSAGYFPGFSADVTGFANCYCANPMISSIPMVIYVFELDNSDSTALAAYLESLKAVADPRWNICTEAEETIAEVYGKYVFFGMFPGEDF